MCPTVMHSIGHTGLLVLAILIKIVKPHGKAYKIFLNNLKQMYTYLKNGDICSSTSTLLDVIHQLRLCLVILLHLHFIQLYYPLYFVFSLCTTAQRI